MALENHLIDEVSHTKNKEGLIISYSSYLVSNQRGVSQFFEGKKIWYLSQQAKRIGIITRKDFLSTMQIYSEGDTYHYIYSFMGKDGKFLYIGQTQDFDVRMRQHKRKHWWGSVLEIRLERSSSRKVAIKREKDLIQKLRPKHNKEFLSNPKKLKNVDVPPVVNVKIDLERISDE